MNMSQEFKDYIPLLRHGVDRPVLMVLVMTAGGQKVKQAARVSQSLRRDISSRNQPNRTALCAWLDGHTNLSGLDDHTSAAKLGSPSVRRTNVSGGEGGFH
jgi:hypothetical protein